MGSTASPLEVAVTLAAAIGLLVHVKGVREAWADWQSVRGRANGRLKLLVRKDLRNEVSRLGLKWLALLWGLGAMWTPRPALAQVIVFEQGTAVVLLVALVLLDVNGYLDRRDRRTLLGKIRQSHKVRVTRMPERKDA